MGKSVNRGTNIDPRRGHLNAHKRSKRCIKKVHNLPKPALKAESYAPIKTSKRRNGAKTLKQNKKGQKNKRHGLAPVSKAPVGPIRSGKICIRGPIYGFSGYARMTNNLILGMDQTDHEFWVDPIPWSVQPTIEISDKLKSVLTRRRPCAEDITRMAGLLAVCLPTDLPSRPIDSNTWNMTIFETTRIPDGWVGILKSNAQGEINELAIKGLIVPSRANLSAFDAAPQKKAIVPLAIDYDTFTPDGPTAALPYASDFNILMSYHMNSRKNPELAMKVINELPADTTVYLKTYGIGMSTWERDGMRDQLARILDGKCRVVLLYDLVSDEREAEIYRAMDLVLNVSHGEGWDLPRCEAYACGTPAIGTLFPAPIEYTIPEFRLINHSLVPCPEIPPFFSSIQKWAEIDLMDVLAAINQVRENRAMYRELALKQRDHLIGYTGRLVDMAEKVWKAAIANG